MTLMAVLLPVAALYKDWIIPAVLFSTWIKTCWRAQTLFTVSCHDSRWNTFNSLHFTICIESYSGSADRHCNLRLVCDDLCSVFCRTHHRYTILHRDTATFVSVMQNQELLNHSIAESFWGIKSHAVGFTVTSTSSEVDKGFWNFRYLAEFYFKCQENNCKEVKSRRWLIVRGVFLWNFDLIDLRAAGHCILIITLWEKKCREL